MHHFVPRAAYFLMGIVMNCDCHWIGLGDVTKTPFFTFVAAAYSFANGKSLHALL